MATQRRFAVMGENLYKIINKLTTNQRICRLLKYQNSNPFDPTLPDIDGLSLLNENFIIVPKYPEIDNIERSYVTIIFDKYIINPQNPDFKYSTVRFEVVCPYSEWIVDEGNLRPYLLMQEIDSLFNQAKLSGLGNLQFVQCVPLTLSPQMGGYTMYYQINEFN